MTKIYLFIFLSAFLYATSFIFSEHVWWFIFLFPAPLFYSVLTEKLSFKNGFFWGFVAFSLHLSGASYATALLAQGAWTLRLLPFICILIYFSIISGITFWITNICTQAIQNKPYHKLLIWCVSLTLYFKFLSAYSLTPFGTQEGYCLLDPLLPLAQNPQLLQLLIYMPKSICTLLLFLVSATIAHAIYTKTKLSFLLFAVAITPWTVCLIHAPKHHSVPAWLTTLYCMPFMTFSCTDNPQSSLLSIAQECKKIIKKHPKTEIIILPESACNSTTIFENKHLFTCFNQHALNKPIHLIFGSFKTKNKKLYNSIYWIHDGIVQAIFNKRNTVLLRERIPQYACYSFLRDTYLYNCTHITASKNKRPLLSITFEISLIPYICSELFCSNDPDDIYPNTTILALVNDSAFITPYLPSYIHTLLHLHSRLKAIEWKRNILYVSYYYADYISKWGKSTKIEGAYCSL